MKKIQIKKAILLSMIGLCLNKKDISAKELNDYLVEQVKYYRTHNDNLILDSFENDIILENTGKQTYGFANYSVSNYEPELGDFIYVWGEGNETSDGIGCPTIDVTPNSEETYEPKVIVGIKNDSAYPYAIATYDEENNKLGEVIGWFKKENISVRVANYSNIIKAPIVKNIVLNDLASDDYTKLNDFYSIKVSYSTKDMPEDYYLNKNGYYVDSNFRCNEKQTLDEENIKKLKKYNIKNK